jgi:TRAP-type mannitol/chloroaromatic compound transport system permease large subunit
MLPAKATKRIVEKSFQKFFLMLTEGSFIVIALFSPIDKLVEIDLNTFRKIILVG